LLAARRGDFSTALVINHLIFFFYWASVSSGQLWFGTRKRKMRRRLELHRVATGELQFEDTLDHKADENASASLDLGVFLVRGCSATSESRVGAAQGTMTSGRRISAHGCNGWAEEKKK
jgi:hypothetical protein